MDKLLKDLDELKARSRSWETTKFSGNQCHPPQQNSGNQWQPQNSGGPWHGVVAEATEHRGKLECEGASSGRDRMELSRRETIAKRLKKSSELCI